MIDCHFLTDKDKASRIVVITLVAREKLWESCQEGLEVELRRELCGLHTDQGFFISQNEDAGLIWHGVPQVSVIDH